QATLEDVLDPMVEKNANQNVADVINYIKATEYALERIKTLPLCSRLIKETHEVLLGGVRGEEKNPGEFRISQNWIGAQGSSLKNARYIPPNVEDMTVAISDLEKYINSDDSLDVLIQAALIHYQFETIHPFLDGNGRVGRLLITLFLMEKKALNSPALYISYYLKKNRIEYYDRMSEVRNKDNYEQWIKFFLRAIAESSDEAVDTIKKLSELHNKNVELISNMKASKSAHIIFSYLENNPIIDIRKTAEELGMSFNTVSGTVKRFEENGILKQTNNVSRNRVFAYEDYLEILRKDTI
ncbi:MAG: Fic family protein, partial [Clostridia bacterium]|nr:Fic family protein [Clostridia bacterium]